MQLNWSYTDDHWTDIPDMDRPLFMSTTKPVLDSDCQKHCEGVVYNHGHSHFALLYLRRAYWEFIYTCDHATGRLYVHRFQYCDRASAERLVSGDASAVAEVIKVLERLDGAPHLWRRRRR